MINLCEVETMTRRGPHPCGKEAGHDGDHVCALVGLCGVTWSTVRVQVVDHLGPCARCGEDVRPLDECSTCLEEDGQVRHAKCCDE